MSLTISPLILSKTKIIDNGGGSAPVNVTPPSIPTTLVVGTSFTINAGTWSGSPTSYNYKLYRGATLIDEQNSASTTVNYTPVQADAGQNIKCTVTATNSAGSASADSNTVAVLATLLDLYPNAAAAYSVRLLRGAYFGSPAIRVRRSNDNAEQNIGFTATGNLDTSALTTFVGSNSGFIVTWYDQSGNANNATQTTPANQHRIVNAGVLESVSGKAAINTLTLPPMVTTAITYTHAITLAKIDTAGTVNYTHYGNGGMFYNGSVVNGLGAFDGTNTRQLTGKDLNRHIGWFSMRGGSMFIQRDGGTETNAGSFASSLNFNNILGRVLDSTVYMRGMGQELVFYNSDISSNRAGIITNINNYYAVY